MRKSSGIGARGRRVFRAAGLVLLGFAAYACGGRIGKWQAAQESAAGRSAVAEAQENSIVQGSPTVQGNSTAQGSPTEQGSPTVQGGSKVPGASETVETGLQEDPLVEESEEKNDYIRWVEFHVTKEALQQAYEYDVNTHGSEHPLDWIELLAYLGAKYGGDFGRYDPKDMADAAEKLQCGDTTIETLTCNMEYYPYYLEAYGAVLDGLVGAYQVQGESGSENNWVSTYGLKAFHPIAKGFPYSDYDDFGVSRSYGYKRNHLGHDMMGQTGTPIIAVESGYVSALGWNQYGGWRIGINSFDGKRYYYYAHLRENFPYAKWLQEGSIVRAGDVIGYMGRTGYSTTENVSNIDISHLHFGLQLIFDESQREGNNEIWIDTYQLIRFLYQNQSETVRDDATKEWSRITAYKDPAADAYEKSR